MTPRGRRHRNSRDYTTDSHHVGWHKHFGLIHSGGWCGATGLWPGKQWNILWIQGRSQRIHYSVATQQKHKNNDTWSHYLSEYFTLLKCLICCFCSIVTETWDSHIAARCFYLQLTQRSELQNPPCASPPQSPVSFGLTFCSCLTLKLSMLTFPTAAESLRGVKPTKCLIPFYGTFLEQQFFHPRITEGQ